MFVRKLVYKYIKFEDELNAAKDLLCYISFSLFLFPLSPQFHISHPGFYQLIQNYLSKSSLSDYYLRKAWLGENNTVVHGLQ